MFYLHFTIVFSLLQDADVLLGSFYRTVCNYRAHASAQGDKDPGLNKVTV